MSVRTSRTRLITVAASAALAALSMTACGGDGDGKAAAAPSSTPAVTAAPPATPAPAPATTAAGGSATASASASAGKGPAGGPQSTAPKPAPTTAPKSPAAPAAAEPTTCQGSNTKTTAAPLNRPVNHMLITVTNTGSGICHLYGYPAVRFGEAQSVPPVITESRPQAVVTLKPGESGYASVNLSSTDGGNGSNGHTVTSLAVYFHGPSGNESVGTGANPSLPANGVYVDDSLKVTYWQQSMDEAVSW